MDTVTIPKKEYKKLIGMKGGSASLTREISKKGEFVDSGFGILKKTVDKISSVRYVNKLRSAWRG